MGPSNVQASAPNQLKNGRKRQTESRTRDFFVFLFFSPTAFSVQPRDSGHDFEKMQVCGKALVGRVIRKSRIRLPGPMTPFTATVIFQAT